MSLTQPIGGAAGALLVALLLCACSAGGASSQGDKNGTQSCMAEDWRSGSLTWYFLDQGPRYEVNCGFPISERSPDRIEGVATGDGYYFGAMNSADYQDAAACGGCVEVSRDDGRRVSITIVDSCPVDTNPKCTRGHIDLSQAAFQQLGGLQEGYLGTDNGGATGRISWRWIPCPTEGRLTFRLKEGANPHWNELLVEEHAYRIAAVEVRVDGEWREAQRQHYNYWRPPGGDMGSLPYRVRAVDVNGGIVEGRLSLTAGPQRSEGQLPICTEGDGAL